MGSTDTARYDRVSAALHWLVALMVIATIIIVLWAEQADRDLGLQLIFLHKSLGMTIFGITVLRIVWRLFHRAPPEPPMPAWQHASARAVHLLLYGLMLALPVTGYMLSSKSPFPLLWFGNEVPKAPITEAAAEAANAVHVVLGLLAIAMIVLHIAAALWHQFGMRDNLIARMRLRS